MAAIPALAVKNLSAVQRYLTSALKRTSLTLARAAALVERGVIASARLTTHAFIITGITIARAIRKTAALVEHGVIASAKLTTHAFIITGTMIGRTVRKTAFSITMAITKLESVIVKATGLFASALYNILAQLALALYRPIRRLAVHIFRLILLGTIWVSTETQAALRIVARFIVSVGTAARNSVAWAAGYLTEGLGYSFTTFSILTTPSPKPVSTDPESKIHTYHVAYWLLGYWLKGLYPRFEGLRPILAQAGMNTSLRGFVSLLFLNAGLTFICSLAILLIAIQLLRPLWVGLPIITAILGSPSQIIIALLLGALGLAVLAFVITYAYPYTKRSGRKTRLDEMLPFTSSYMTVLAAAGLSPVRILRGGMDHDPKLILSDEMRSVISKIDLLGYDTLTALEMETKRSPSLTYANMLRGFSATIRTGGDLKKYFLNTTRHLLESRKLRLQQFLDTLVMLADVFVIMLVAFPLMVIIMFSVMAAVGGNVGGFGVFSVMYLLTFVLIPIFATMFLVFIDMIQPKS